MIKNQNYQKIIAPFFLKKREWLPPKKKQQ